MARSRINPRGVLFLTVVALTLLAFAPTTVTWWVAWFRGPLMAVVAPISGPLTHVSRWLRPGDTRRTLLDDPEINELRLLSEWNRTELLRAQRENERLRLVIESLQQGIGYGEAQRLRLLEATRVGSGADAGTIEVARGTLDGVTLQSVATALEAPQHLVGLVVLTGPTVSTVRLVTDPQLSPNWVEAIMLTEAPLDAGAVSQAPRCQFRPGKDGTLEGDLDVQKAERVSKGDLAYVDDDHWPDGAQGLVLARVVRIEETANPLFRRIVLRPDFDLARVRGVLLRIPVEESAGDATWNPEAGR